MSKTNGILDITSTKRFDFSLVEHLPESEDITSIGEGLKILEQKTVELNYEFATEILSLPEFCADRKLDSNHVLRLKMAMERGTFLPEQVNIVTCRCDGKVYRCNGQHTAYARLAMPKDYRCPVRHIRYSAKTENDMRRLYASLDRGKGRTKSNVVTSYLFETDEWSGFGKHVIGWIAEGLALWLWPKQHEQLMHDGDDRAYLLMTEYLNLGRLVGNFIQSHQSDKIKFLRRAPVVAAMFATFNKDASAAQEFWDSVALGVGFPHADDPRRVLRDNLMQSSIKSTRSANSTKKAVSQEEMLRWSIQAWNAYRRGERLKVLRANLLFDRSEVV